MIGDVEGGWESGGMLAPGGEEIASRVVRG